MLDLVTPPATNGSAAADTQATVMGAKSRPTQPRQPSLPEFYVEVVRGTAGLTTILDEWNDLAVNAVERNPFYEPWMLMPALAVFGQNIDLQFYLVWQRSPRPNQPSTLVGFFPLELRRGFGGLPVRLLKVWQHDYLYYCVPLVRRTVAHQTLNTLFDHFSQSKPRVGVFELHHADSTGAFSQVLLDVTSQRMASTFVADAYNRALFRPAADYDSYIAASMTNHNRQEIRRKQRRLSEQGELEVRLLQPSDNVDNWLNAFLDLEAAGWKGQEQTALACHNTSRSYFDSIARAAFQRGQLMMVGLFLDQRPIALKCNFLAGDGSYAFKIAFDESLSKVSPGVQLELENLRLLHDIPSTKWMDSCATRQHFMIDRLWSERRTIHKLLVSTGSWFDNVCVDAIATLSAVRRALRRRPKPSKSES